MIVLENVTKRYERQTVIDVPQLQIAKNESFGLVGNNGAGKTTLFRIILDLIRPTTGSVTINNTNVQGNDEWKKWVGSYLDENFLIPYLTPEEYFFFVGKLHGYTQADLKLLYEKFEELFYGEILGGSKYIGDLSKGNIKKVSII